VVVFGSPGTSKETWSGGGGRVPRVRSTVRVCDPLWQLGYIEDCERHYRKLYQTLLTEEEVVHVPRPTAPYPPLANVADQSNPTPPSWLHFGPSFRRPLKFVICLGSRRVGLMRSGPLSFTRRVGLSRLSVVGVRLGMAFH